MGFMTLGCGRSSRMVWPGTLAAATQIDQLTPIDDLSQLCHAVPGPNLSFDQKLNPPQTHQSSTLPQPPRQAHHRTTSRPHATPPPPPSNPAEPYQKPRPNRVSAPIFPKRTHQPYLPTRPRRTGFRALALLPIPLRVWAPARNWWPGCNVYVHCVRLYIGCASHAVVNRSPLFSDRFFLFVYCDCVGCVAPAYVHITCLLAACLPRTRSPHP